MNTVVQHIMSWVERKRNLFVPESLEIVLVSLEELELPKNMMATRYNVFDHAFQTHKLVLLNAHQAAEIRISHKSHQGNHPIFVGMKTVKGKNEEPYIFVFGHENDHPQISTELCPKDYLFKSGTLFIFGQALDQYKEQVKK